MTLDSKSAGFNRPVVPGQYMHLNAPELLSHS